MNNHFKIQILNFIQIHTQKEITKNKPKIYKANKLYIYFFSNIYLYPFEVRQYLNVPLSILLLFHCYVNKILSVLILVNFSSIKII
jgi:hypothetical protein